MDPDDWSRENAAEQAMQDIILGLLILLATYAILEVAGRIAGLVS